MLFPQTALDHAGTSLQISNFAWIVQDGNAEYASVTTLHSPTIKARRAKQKGEIRHAELRADGDSWTTKTLKTQALSLIVLPVTTKTPLQRFNALTFPDGHGQTLSRSTEDSHHSHTLPAFERQLRFLLWSPVLMRCRARRHCKNNTQLCIIIVLYPRVKPAIPRIRNATPHATGDT